MPLNSDGAYISLRQEEISYAYLNAIGAAAGYSVEIRKRMVDNSGIDISIEAPGAVEDCMAPSIDAQVKCTYQDCIRNGSISHSLKARNYNRLAHPNPQKPCILIVVLVDKEVLRWTRHGKKLDRISTIVKASAYWISIKGLPEIKEGTEKTIKIPVSNRLTPMSLIDLMRQVANEETL